LPASLARSQLGLYLQTVRYFDTVLGDFLAKLDERGLLDRSVIVLYGDHSARLGHDRKHHEPASYSVAVGLRDEARAGVSRQRLRLRGVARREHHPAHHPPAA